MIPGIQAALSESTVASTTSTMSFQTDIVRLTGTESATTIAPPAKGFSGFVFVVPIDGNVATVTTGNISLAVTMPVSRATLLVYSKLSDKWYPGAIS
jgi:hypothetical protein